MVIRLKKVPIRAMYICPFCKIEIISSHRTEIFYRSDWINGCDECFSLSIGILTSKSFQTRDY